MWSQVLPFILLGIGVDDIFVMVRSVEEVDEMHPGLAIPERFRKALNLGGMSITVTSVTNAVAFMFGSLTAIPAVQWYEPVRRPSCRVQCKASTVHVCTQIVAPTALIASTAERCRCLGSHECHDMNDIDMAFVSLCPRAL